MSETGSEEADREFLDTCGDKAHTSLVKDVSGHSKNENLFGSAGDDGQLIIWDLETNKPPHCVQAHEPISSRLRKMDGLNASSNFSLEMDDDAIRRLFPLLYHERHLLENMRPDGRTLGKARDTTLAVGAVASADGSALAKIGCTTMLAAIKMEVMSPSTESPDEGCIAIDFHMPPICSPLVRPGRPAEAAPVVSKQLSDTILNSGMIDLKELSLVSGKAAWMAYLDIYCLDADGSLFYAALLSAVAAFSHLQIPVVSLNDDGRVVIRSERSGGKEKEPVNKGKRKLTLRTIPFSLTCILHKNYILADPTAEEESNMETLVTVVLDSSFQLVSFNKPGGPVLAYTTALQEVGFGSLKEGTNSVDLIFAFKFQRSNTRGSVMGIAESSAFVRREYSA